MLLRIFLIFREGFSLFIFYRCASKDPLKQKEIGKRIRLACERLGPTYIKLGQMLSMRPDFIPKEWCIELEHLLDSAPSIPVSEVKKVVERELKKSPSYLFKDFENKPLASASLSQVHRATLFSGEKVIIKVLRPNVKKIIQQDIKCIRLVVKVFSSRIQIERKHIIDLVNILGTWLESETDYSIELNNMLVMNREIDSERGIYIPVTYGQYSTKEVLVMEYIEGSSILDLIRIQREGKISDLHYSIQEVLERLIVEIGIKGLLRPHFHADLHPANIIIQPDGTICLLDFGLIQYFDKRTRKDNALMMIGISYASPELILFASKKIALFPQNHDEKRIFADLSKICDRYKDAPASEMSTSQLLAAVISMGLEHGIVFPWPLILYTRSAMHIDGMVLNLCPEFVFSNYSRDKFIKVYTEIALGDIVSIPSFIQNADTILEAIKKYSSSY